ncbi:MAG: hypothetical protein QM691_11725 [Opitutaceae bacterium]
MDYIEDQLQRTQPELLIPYREALKVLETDFAMRFSFSALLLRQIAEMATDSGAPKEITKTEHDYPWLPDDAFYFSGKGTNKTKKLSQRGHFLIFAYGSQNPEDRFSAAQRQAVDDAFAQLKSIIEPLNKAVHEVVYSSNLSDKDGRALIDKVRKSLDQVLRLKRTVLGIVEIKASDSVSVGISLLGVSYTREIPYPTAEL